MENPTTETAARTFGQRLKAARHAAGLTQWELATRLNLQQNAINRYEIEGVIPSVRTAWELADALGVTLGELAGQGEQPPRTLPGETFGAKLRHARDSAGLTQLEVATELGTNKGQVRYYEYDRTTPSVDRACELADVLGVRLDDLRPGH